MNWKSYRRDVDKSNNESNQTDAASDHPASPFGEGIVHNRYDPVGQRNGAAQAQSEKHQEE